MPPSSRATSHRRQSEFGATRVVLIKRKTNRKIVTKPRQSCVARLRTRTTRHTMCISEIVGTLTFPYQHCFPANNSFLRGFMLARVRHVRARVKYAVPVARTSIHRTGTILTKQKFMDSAEFRYVSLALVKRTFAAAAALQQLQQLDFKANGIGIAARGPAGFLSTDRHRRKRQCPMQDTGTRRIVKCSSGDEKKRTSNHPASARRTALIVGHASARERRCVRARASSMALVA